MKTKIRGIWNEMLNEYVAVKGLIFRRLSAVASEDIYVGIRDPERLPFIAFGYQKSHLVNTGNFSKIKDISVENIVSPENPAKVWLTFSLLNQYLLSNFTDLSADLVTSVSQICSDRQRLKKILTRLEKWQSLFELHNN